MTRDQDKTQTCYIDKLVSKTSKDVCGKINIWAGAVPSPTKQPKCGTQAEGTEVCKIRMKWNCLICGTNMSEMQVKVV